jgi:nitroreductase
MDATATRLHVRRYTNQTIGKDCIRTLLQAAMSAHSEGDERPWQFVVVQDLATRKRIAEVHPAVHIVAQAPVVIVVGGDQTLQKHPGFWVQDCAAATENMLIQAQAMGLGAMWFGIYPVDGRVHYIRKILDLPLTVVPFSLTSVGYPAEHNGLKCEYDASRVHLDRWQRGGSATW